MAIRFAILGLGWAGQKHLRTLAGVDGAEIAAVADADPGLARAAAAAYGARPYSHWAELLEAEVDLEAVVLSLPSGERLDAVDDLCDREIALFCEAPPSVSLEAALKAARTVRRAGVLNAVCLQGRWSLAASALRELIRRRPRLFARTAVAVPVFDWVAEGSAPRSLLRKEESGGPLIEQGIHLIDALRYITGDEPVSVQAMAELGAEHPTEGRDSEETTLLTLRHRSGMLSSHLVNWSHRGALAQLQLVGPSFELTWDLSGEERLHGRLDGKPVEEGSAVDPRAEALREFVEAVRRRDQSLIRCDFAEACRSLAVCHAAGEAAASGDTRPVPDVSARLETHRRG